MFTSLYGGYLNTFLIADINFALQDNVDLHLTFIEQNINESFQSDFVNDALNFKSYLKDLFIYYGLSDSIKYPLYTKTDFKEKLKIINSFVELKLLNL